MIKFFRKIRQKLIIQKKMGEYLKYAIGEIILVVIGILIALQINNWNQARLEKQKSKEYHQRLVEELDLMIDGFHKDSIRARKMTIYLMSTVNLFEKSNITPKELDTVDYALKNYFQFVRIDGLSNTYEEMKSSGDLGLIYDKELREALNSYVSRISAISKIYDQLASQVSETSVTDKYIKNKVRLNVDSEITFDFNRMKKDALLMNQLSRFAENWKTKMHFSGMLKSSSIKLRNNIQKLLNND